MSLDDPAVYDHVTPAADGRGAGDEKGVAGDDTVYRVVGVGDDRVTLLRLTDADGNREATGELRHVAREALSDRYVAADDPDPRWEWPDYLGGLFVVAGVAAAVHPAVDLASGVLLVVAGGYVLWRRN